MFPTSTQLKYWTFPASELENLREEANHRYIKNHSQSDESRSKFFLTVEEEAKIRRYYEYELKNFCLEFQPTMPLYVMGTAMTYFKRFYLHMSVMDHHPKNILYACVYLACKVEEFNIQIQQFVRNMPFEDEEKATDLIISQELLLMEALHFHLTIHNPYRPVEGLVIDIKTRCPEISDPEKLRKGVDAFLLHCLNTDACLLFSPSQVALGALVSSGANCGISLDSYVANKLADSKDNLRKIVDHIQKLRQMVKQVEIQQCQLKQLEAEVKVLEGKLEECRNQKNNPDSIHYRQLLEEFSDDENESQILQKKMRTNEESPMEHDMS